MAELEMLFLRVARKIGSRSQKGFNDDYCMRIALHCLELADRSEMTADQKKALVAAAFLHDLGERKIRPEVINKNGHLTRQERTEMKEHVLLSAGIVQDIEFPWPLVLAYVKYHHERYDGTGYPLGLKGEEIHLGTRILSLCDFYVALTTDRVYRKAFSVQEALKMVQAESGKMFDPKFVGIFLNPSFRDFLLSMSGNSHPFDFTEIWNRLQPNMRIDRNIKFPFNSAGSIIEGKKLTSQPRQQTPQILQN